jgi:hypothetical protein
MDFWEMIVNRKDDGIPPTLMQDWYVEKWLLILRGAFFLGALGSFVSLFRASITTFKSLKSAKTVEPPKKPQSKDRKQHLQKLVSSMKVQLAMDDDHDEPSDVAKPAPGSPDVAKPTPTPAKIPG